MLQICRLPRRPSELSGLDLSPVAAYLYDCEHLAAEAKFRKWCGEMAAAKRDPDAYLTED